MLRAAAPRRNEAGNGRQDMAYKDMAYKDMAHKDMAHKDMAYSADEMMTIAAAIR